MSKGVGVPLPVEHLNRDHHACADLVTDALESGPPLRRPFAGRKDHRGTRGSASRGGSRRPRGGLARGGGVMGANVTGKHQVVVVGAGSVGSTSPGLLTVPMST